MSVMKVAFVIDKIALVGGAERLILDICSELDQRKNTEIKIYFFIETDKFHLDFKNEIESYFMVNQNVKQIFLKQK